MFVDRVAWDLAKEICQPTLSSLSPEVNMLRRDIMSLLATKGDARELFTALLEVFNCLFPWRRRLMLFPF